MYPSNPLESLSDDTPEAHRHYRGWKVLLRVGRMNASSVTAGEDGWVLCGEGRGGVISLLWMRGKWW